MNNRFTRRQFVAAMAAGVATASALPRSLAAKNADENKFSFLLLGDTHFDRMEHHDLDWMREHFAKDIPQVENYCRLTTEKLPQLLQAARTRLSETPSPAAFVLHVGDLIEGICGNKELATQHCEEGWEFFRKAEFGVPLLMTKGNHDVTGPGAEEAYAEVLLQMTAKELGRESLDRASYSFMQGDNLFAVFDAYDRDAILWLEQTVKKNKFARLFVLLHLPVVPYSARASWRVYNHPNQAEQRQRLLDLLGTHNAIVLCGHLHKYSLLVRRCRTGKFTQLAISSIVKRASDTKNVLEDVADYGADLVDLEPTFSPESVDQRRKILANEKPFIEHFQYADNSGFAIFSVDDEDVRANVFTDTEASEPWKSLSLLGIGDS